MTRLALKRLALAGAALIAFAAQASAMVVPLNRSTLITTGQPIGEVMIANPDIADIHVHGNKRVSVIGKSRGITTLRIMDKDGELLKTVDINVTYDLPEIRRALMEFMPEEQVGVELVNKNIALVGTVSNAAAVDKALRIARQFIDEQVLAAGAQSNNPRGLEGDILNLLTVTSGQQVMLRVRVGEIRRTALKRLGVSVNGLSVNGDTAFGGYTQGGIGRFNTSAGDASGGDTGTGTGNPATDALFGTVGAVINEGDFQLGASLEALEKDGLLKILAEPNLVALSGEKAEFLAGGEYPVPVAQNSGGVGVNNITIQYKPFGVAVQFIPYVLAENRIRLTVLPEVSELSEEDAVQVSGVQVPALTTRRAKTTVELAPGESFMIAGLIREDMSTVLRQLPGINEIPILSALFRSSEFQRNETELVIAVTPYLVDPVKSGDVRLPTDGFRPPSTMETVFYGALSSISHGERRISQTPMLEGPIGFMLD